jgi:mycothiol S-conjugate amidase
MQSPVDRDGNPLCLLSVHAHPDDEASKGSGTVARYNDEGIRGVLVCCTGGEAGDILNPAVDTPENRADLGRVRLGELEASAAAIGYSSVHLLGYHDSGMPGTDINDRADNFANAPLEEAVGRLVGLIRMERPQVIITYAEDRQFYPHPDHIRVHEISLPAFDAAGDPEQFPEAGPPWQPSKMYYTGFSRRRVVALHEAYLARGEESPYASWFERGLPERADSFTTFVDVGDYLHRRRAALLAHRTQVDPAGFWMRIPDDVIREVFPWEEFLLARSLVDTGFGDGEVEDDLFAGLRAG